MKAYVKLKISTQTGQRAFLAGKKAKNVDRGFSVAVTDISSRHAWLFIYSLGHVLVSSHGAVL